MKRRFNITGSCFIHLWSDVFIVCALSVDAKANWIVIEEI